MHTLLPLSFTTGNFDLPDFLFSAISDGSAKPDFDSGDDPLWTNAIHSPQHEYWIAGICKELHNLANLQVFILIPRSDVPCGRRPLKGKLVCKCKCNNAGNIVRYKVCHIAKGYT